MLLKPTSITPTTKYCSTAAALTKLGLHLKKGGREKRLSSSRYSDGMRGEDGGDGQMWKPKQNIFWNGRSCVRKETGR
ncbi:unnamed protein product [Cercopithifilaria johnstoni]|uniref:Uncharacterized protein n=1 Tax=Cercopithifilaria johnstoni TaxID=2874296 RepID=A0A8J2Q6P8_9BILA|nr:unnamed protein product [Cercopithifilaria johnstoni]